MKKSISSENPISDNEIVYRRVKNKGDCIEYYYDENDNLVLEDEAFRDGSRKPSVSIARLLNFKPEKAITEDVQGIVEILTKRIKLIPDVITELDNDQIKHKIKVKHEPSPIDHLNSDQDEIARANAHALIVARPDFTGTRKQIKDTFRKLKVALARTVNKYNNGEWKHPPKTDNAP